MADFKKLGLCNALDGSEDHLIQFKDGKDLYDMSKILPLSRWKKDPPPARDDFSDSDDDDPFDEFVVHRKSDIRNE